MMLRAKLVDTHCHLDFPEYNNDREEVIRRAKEQGLAYIINISSSLESAKKSLELAKQYDFIYSAIGLHPHEADKLDPRTIQTLKNLSLEKKVMAVGETGLDFYYDKPNPDAQEVLFRHLIDLAKEKSLPLIIHCRQAQDLARKILKQKAVIQAVVHCFSGDESFLRYCLDSGFYISFTCNITYKNSDHLRNLAKLVPNDRLLLETDAPFLAPQIFRGKRNEPAYVRYLAEEISRIKGLTFEEVCQITTQNAKNFFKLP